MRPVAPLPVPVIVSSEVRVSTVAQLAEIPEEEIWLAKQKSARTRRAYRLDVRHFMRALGITEIDAAAPGRSPRRHRVGADAARAGRRRSIDHPPPPRGTVQLFKHLVRHGRGEPQSGRATSSGRRSIATKAAPLPSRKRRRASCSTRRRADTHRRSARPRHSVGRLAGRFSPRGNRRAQCRRPAPEPGL